MVQNCQSRIELGSIDNLVERFIIPYCDDRIVTFFLSVEFFLGEQKTMLIADSRRMIVKHVVLNFLNFYLKIVSQATPN